MSSILIETPGPRAQRRMRIANIVSIVVLLALAGWALWQFLQAGAFAPSLWAEFVDFEEGWPLFLLKGLLNAVRAAAVAMVLAVVVGLVAALGRLSNTRVVRAVATVYVEVFRSTPLLLLILFIFLVAQFRGIAFINPFWGLVLGLSLYNSAVLGEIFRAGVLSLPGGQAEAASSIGMTYWQSMRLVLLPQAVRRMVPAIVAQLASLTKDTSLGYVIAYPELLRRAQSLGQSFPINTLQAYTVVAVLYFLVIYLLSRVARHLELRQRRRYGGRIQATTGMEDVGAISEEADVLETELPDQAAAGTVASSGSAPGRRAEGGEASGPTSGPR